MLIEFLYPELSNLYGESGHVRFIKSLFADAEFVETSLADIPAFSHRDVDLMFMGAMSERAQEKIIHALLPYRVELKNRFDTGCFALFTGNAMEVLGQAIDCGDGRSIEALGIFPFMAKRQMQQRLNCFFLGQLCEKLISEARQNDLDDSIVGFKTQFSQCYLTEEAADPGCFCQTEKGFGLNKKQAEEGYVYKNVICTYLIGPLLITNPDFTKLWLRRMGKGEIELPFEATLQAAYKARLADFRKNDTVL